MTKVLDETKIKLMVGEIIGQGIPVSMKNEPAPHAWSLVRGARILITVRQLDQVGTDETLYDGDGADMVESYARMREATISFRFESDAGPYQTLRAYNLAETFRNALSKRYWRARCKECGFAPATLQTIQDFDGVWDNRQVDVAILDVRVNCGYLEVDPPADHFVVINENNHVPRDPTIETPEQPEGSGGWSD